MRTNGIFVYDINDMTCHTRNMICHTSGMVLRAIQVVRHFVSYKWYGTSYRTSGTALRTVQVIIFAYSGKTASEELAVFMFCVKG